MEHSERVAARVAGLRALADHLEQHPDLVTVSWQPDIEHELFASTLTAEEVAELVSQVGGERIKRTAGTGDGLLQITRDFGGGVLLSIYADRGKVCERRVVGTRTEMVPDPDYLKAAPMVPKVVEDVEWNCNPVLQAAS